MVAAAPSSLREEARESRSVTWRFDASRALSSS
jgi:hypothetical protein